MFRLPPLIRNFFIRLEGRLYQFFNLLKKLLGWFNQLLAFFGKLFGFTNEQYSILEADTAAGLTENRVGADRSEQTPQASSPAASSTRRLPDAKNMEYYLKLAEPKKASNRSRR